MALVTWDQLYPDVLVYVPGCPDPTLDQALRDAAIEFLRRTRAWMPWLESSITTSSLREFDLDLPPQSEVVRIEAATLDARPLAVRGFRTIPMDSASYVDGAGLSLTSTDRITVWLTQTVGAGAKLQVLVSLVPSRSATGLDDTLLTKHRLAIVEGAKHRLMRMPGPLHQPKPAAEALQLFERAVAASSVDAWRGHTNHTPRATPKWC